jgi:hypothetical protein
MDEDFLLQAKYLTLDEVHQLLNLQPSLQRVRFGEVLTLTEVTEWEMAEMEQIRIDFQAYWQAGKVLEGQVQMLVLSPLLRLAGFYRSPIQLSLEQAIGEISIVDEETTIAGRLDLLAVRRASTTPLWILVVESKNSQVDALNGLPQLLTYASRSLSHQRSVWGLVTNGISYYFTRLMTDEIRSQQTYQLLPELNLLDSDRALVLLQVLKAIRESEDL